MTRYPGNIYSDEYKLLVYFAHSRLMIYNASIISNQLMTAEEFMEKNKLVFERVTKDCKFLFGKELYNDQLKKAAISYIKSKYSPASIKDNEIFNPNTQL